MHYSSYYQTPSELERKNIQRQFLANYSNLGYSSLQLTKIPTDDYQFKRYYEAYPYYYNKFYEDYPYSGPPKNSELYSQKNSYVTRNEADNSMKSASAFLDNKPPRTYTTTVNIIYKSGQQSDKKINQEDLTKTITNFDREKIMKQYKQPNYVDREVYNNDYNDTIDRQMREQLQKTLKREEIQEYKNQIIHVFKEIVLFEKEIENIKQSLCKQKDVSLNQIFKMFDLESNNQVTPFELDRGLKQIGILADKIDLYLLTIRYSKDGREYLKDGEFFEMIEPSKKDPQFSDVYQDKNILFQDMSELTQQYILKLFKMLLNLESSVQYCCNQLQYNKFDLEHLFKQFDLNNINAVKKEELFQWMKINGIYINENEFKKFFLRFDKNNSEIMHIEEFKEALTPKNINNRR